jgi:hypothetical protein
MSLFTINYYTSQHIQTPPQRRSSFPASATQSITSPSDCQLTKSGPKYFVATLSGP